MGPFTVKRNLRGNYIGFRNSRDSRKNGWNDADDIARQMYREVALVNNCHIEGVGLELGMLCLNYMYEVRACRWEGVCA